MCVLSVWGRAQQFLALFAVALLVASSNGFADQIFDGHVDTSNVTDSNSQHFALMSIYASLVSEALRFQDREKDCRFDISPNYFPNLRARHAASPKCRKLLTHAFNVDEVDEKRTGAAIQRLRDARIGRPPWPTVFRQIVMAINEVETDIARDIRSVNRASFESLTPRDVMAWARMQSRTIASGAPKKPITQREHVIEKTVLSNDVSHHSHWLIIATTADNARTAIAKLADDCDFRALALLHAMVYEPTGGKQQCFFLDHWGIETWLLIGSRAPVRLGAHADIPGDSLAFGVKFEIGRMKLRRR